MILFQILHDNNVIIYEFVVFDPQVNLSLVLVRTLVPVYCPLIKCIKMKEERMKNEKKEIINQPRRTKNNNNEINLKYMIP